MRGLTALFLLLAALTLLPGCQNSAPRIESTDWELFRIRSTADGEVFERLSLFLAATDEEGRDDLDQLYLFHPESRLYWELTGEEWEERNRDGREWIGGSTFEALGQLPRGEYRYILIDRAGERSEESLFIDLPRATDEEEEFFPSLRREGEFLFLDTGDREALLVAESAEGRVFASYRSRDSRLSINSLGEAGERESNDWYLFVYREEYGWYAGSGPYRF